MTTVGGATTLWNDNHTMLGWESTAEAQIKTWLG
jgi:hypothetical protein